MGPAGRGRAAGAALSDPAPESIGRYLAAQRELRGISLDALAAQTGIPRRTLERLEADPGDRLPDGLMRGLVRTVAAALGLDPGATVLRMLAEPTREITRSTRRIPLRIALIGIACGFGVALLLWSGLGGPAAILAAEAGGARAARVRQDPVQTLARELRGRTAQAALLEASETRPTAEAAAR